MRFVPIKTDDQLDLQELHRVRDRLIARRASVTSQLRAFLMERGLVGIWCSLPPLRAGIGALWAEVL
jgi:transposase